MSIAVARAQAGTEPLVMLSVTAALAVYALYLALGVLRAGGGFEYPLDDVYIHLAMAAEIARGGYGVNAGEAATASSSILYPLLLAPFPETGIQLALPLMWNVAALTASAALWGHFLGDLVRHEGLPRWAALALAILVPLGVNMAGVAFTGMENGIHGLLTLCALAGLYDFLRTGRIGALLVLGIALGPLVRYEGLAVSLAAAGVVALNGRAPAGILLAALPLAGLAAYAGYLAALGLDPVPNSVLVKLGVTEAAQSVRAPRMMARFLDNLRQTPGMALFAMTLLASVLTAAAAAGRDRMRVWLGLFGVAVAAAHMLIGKFGWMDRYEHYVLLLTAGVLCLLIAPYLHRRAGQALALLAAAALVALTVFYQANLSGRGQWAPRGVFLQHAQMARFVRDHLKAPVAVNDLGRVAWRNPHYVLDLWGLASREALEIRGANPPDGWAGPLAAREGVQLAMIYDHLLKQSVPPEWIRIGDLGITGPAGYLIWREVAFYATDPETADAVVEQVRGFVATLPEGAVFAFDPETERADAG